MSKLVRGLTIRAAAKDTTEVELLIYDVIGRDWDGSGVTAKDVAEELKKYPKAKLITVSLNSSGGSVPEALAIYNTLLRSKARVVVSIDGMALSAASVVAMVGDEIAIAENAVLMLHNPMAVIVFASADDLREEAELLDKSAETLVATYAARSGQDEQVIRDWMEAETWFNAQEAIDNGFADRMVKAKRVAAFGDLSRYKRAPAELLAQFDNPSPATEAAAGESEDNAMSKDEKTDESAVEAASAAADGVAQPKPATIADLKTALPKADSSFLVECLEESLTMVQAKDRWIARLEAKADGLQKDVEAAQAKAAKPGVEPLGDGDPGKRTDVSDPIAQWNEAVSEKTKAGMDKARAIAAVAKEKAELHASYVAAYNQVHGRQVA